MLLPTAFWNNLTELRYKDQKIKNTLLFSKLLVFCIVFVRPRVYNYRKWQLLLDGIPPASAGGICPVFQNKEGRNNFAL